MNKYQKNRLSGVHEHSYYDLTEMPYDTSYIPYKKNNKSRKKCCGKNLLIFRQIDKYKCYVSGCNHIGCIDRGFVAICLECKGKYEYQIMIGMKEWLKLTRFFRKIFYRCFLETRS